ncbi:MAG TPA: hypothetical protein V6D08_18175 [Candidatus Obscuribacterales bacterium]
MTELHTDVVRLVNHGQIASMDMPPGWIETAAKQYTGAGAQSFRKFHPPDRPDAKLCFFYRGAPVSASSARALREVLAKPAHDLDPSEFSSLAEVLRDRSDPEQFHVRDIRTEDLKGRRLLVIEGSYERIEQDTYALLIDADGSGRFVQEIYFMAPFIDYVTCKMDVEEAVKSIVWK